MTAYRVCKRHCYILQCFDESPDNHQAFDCFFFRPNKKRKHSAENKRKYRKACRKRRRNAKQQSKQDIVDGFSNIQRENKHLADTIKVKKSIKQKYYELARKSEIEREHLRTSRHALLGSVMQNVAKEQTEVLQIDLSIITS